MTQKRRDNHSTEFGLWLRKQGEIDSSLGFIATNVDFVWRNYKTGEWLLLEEKRYGRDCPRWQKEIFAVLHRAARNDPKYRGFYFVKFEKTSPEDGKLWINNRESNRETLLKLLRFEFQKEKEKK